MPGRSPSSPALARAALWVVGLMLLAGGGARAQPAAAAASAPSAARVASAPQAAPGPPLSLSASKVYAQARSQLVQIRTVLKGQTNQTSVGSGFIVSPQGHIVTNYHVVSEAALQPGRRDLVYVTADGHEAPLQLLMIDVLHDLALVKAAPRAEPFDALRFRSAGQPLGQGERMYSFGIPMDVGFAVIEGNYNGLIARSFYPQIFFSGALNSGMSGGPALDQEGRVVGINVARLAGSEEVGFLVPAEFAVTLLQRGRDAKPITTPVWPIVLDQLTTHQALLTDRFIRQGWRPSTHPRYVVPVSADRFMPCWGGSKSSTTGGLDVERSSCAMEHGIFVGEFSTGAMAMSHESYVGRNLGAMRFAARYAKRFGNADFERLSDEHQTPPQCREDYVDRGGLPLRVVVCMRAYRKLPKLYDASVLVVTLDQAQSGLQGRFDVQGVTYANAMKLTRHFLEGWAWVPSR